MTSWILMSRSSSVAADTASFRVKTKRTLSRFTCPPRSTPLHGAWRGHQSAAAHPSLSPAAITTSKHLLHLQGRLCCAWRGFSFQVTHTERFAAFVMIGCVKYNAMILGVSVTHNC